MAGHPASIATVGEPHHTAPEAQLRAIPDVSVALRKPGRPAGGKLSLSRTPTTPSACRSAPIRRTAMAAPDQPGDRDNAGPDCHIECARVEAEIPDEDLLSHFIADIVVWPVEDAQHIDAAHDPDHPAPIVNHRKPVHPAGHTFAWPRRPRCPTDRWSRRARSSVPRRSRRPPSRSPPAPEAIRCPASASCPTCLSSRSASESIPITWSAEFSTGKRSRAAPE